MPTHHPVRWLTLWTKWRSKGSVPLQGTRKKQPWTPVALCAKRKVKDWLGFSPPPTQDLMAGVFEAPAWGSSAASTSGSPWLSPLLALKHRPAIISPVNPALGLFPAFTLLPAVTVWEPAPRWHCHMSAKLILAILIKKWLKQSVYLNGSVFYLCYSWILDSY